jgi:8-oxo-dGTP pyrophosphatase MutT (NUDIX family)
MPAPVTDRHITMDSAESKAGKVQATSGKEHHAPVTAYGGVVIRDDGRVLLREPRGHYYGYVWTFPKGKPDQGETPEVAATREVWEETGVEAVIESQLPGVFASESSDTIYFLMSVRYETGRYDAETDAIRWATPDEARALIAQTTNRAGRERDLRALEAAVDLWQQRHRT